MGSCICHVKRTSSAVSSNSNLSADLDKTAMIASYKPTKVTGSVVMVKIDNSLMRSDKIIKRKQIK
jgi:hypothetical protein